MVQISFAAKLKIKAMPDRLARIKSAHFDDDVYLQKMKEIFKMLPELNQDVLKYILDFLGT